MSRKSIARGWRLASAVLALAALPVRSLLAQAEGALPPPTPPSVTVRPLWTEALIVVLVIGLALFAVCRNSNRT